MTHLMRDLRTRF